MKNKMRAMMLMLLMCWASLSLAQPTWADSEYDGLYRQRGSAVGWAEA